MFFGFGLVVGLLVFSRFLRLVLDRYHGVTLAFLGGLVAGSLYPLWPFKLMVELQDVYVKRAGAIELVDKFQVYSNLNVLPRSGDWVVPFFCFLAGCVAMALFLVKDQKERVDG